MFKLKFRVTLVDPLILSSSDRTEVTIGCLDYIPGNIFLGIVAGKLYDEKDTSKTLDLFHNGNVQFSNAYLSINKKQSNPIPAVCYKEKGKDLSDKVYLYHKLTDVDWDEFAKKGIQIKQERNGYFIEEEGKFLYSQAKKGVVLKSAYNSNRKSAKKEQMYMFDYLEAEQQFIFTVRASKEEYLKEIKNILKGKRNIAKSKSAEFGGVLFECISDITNDEGTKTCNSSKNIIVYAKSNLAFINEYGEFTWQPTASNLGFDNAIIDYEKSQLYFDKFHIRNGKRRSHDADRLIIKKGSVFILKGNPEINFSKINKGVGVFLSEGYGKIKINPSFFDIFETKKVETKVPDVRTKKTISNNPQLVELLKERNKDNTTEQQVYTDVANFIKNNYHLYKNISSSQWGAIRSYIYQSNNKINPQNFLYTKLFNFDKSGSPKNGYLYHGKMGIKWNGNKVGFLKEFIVLKDDNGNEEAVDMNKLLLLTIEMPKRIK